MPQLSLVVASISRLLALPVTGSFLVTKLAVYSTIEAVDFHFSQIKNRNLAAVAVGQSKTNLLHSFFLQTFF